MAVIEGGNAAKSAPIFWEGVQVTQANNGRNFAFQGVVPADCVGKLEDGVPADAIDVALANCEPVSGAPAPVPQTGQTQCYNPSGGLIPCEGTGQDGDIQAGVPLPSLRFTDRGNGTVRDNLTGLIWLKNTSCFDEEGRAQALTDANTLASPNCGLSDGSLAGDWRLPNIEELYSLLDFSFFNPALSNAAGTGHWTEGDAFSGLRFGYGYCSSTSPPDHPVDNWRVQLNNGITGATANLCYVWPVRGPE